ncbi:hypothetical protein NDU88_004446 [Pleurodeles waltl]|uniref:Uncharacterized protein n=1 Tax=Pleurodeles waltl TaxID=8319 RepID=A0AAV7QFW7_PLEWA|nr:hypothetical protein NDU88_004446 [Pleurodeles waltl]
MELKRKDGLKRSTAVLEEGEEDRHRKEERGVPHEEPHKGEPPREIGADNGDTEGPEAPRREDTPSTVRNPRSNASHIPGGTWLSQVGENPVEVTGLPTQRKAISFDKLGEHNTTEYNTETQVALRSELVDL